MNNEEDFNENEELENSYYDSSYDINNDLERLDNSYFDSDYDTNKDLERLNNSYYDNPSDNELLNEPAPEEAVSGGSRIGGTITDIKAVAKKGLWELLKKNPWILGVAAAILFFGFVALLVFQMDFDLVGVGHPSPKYYQEAPSCGEIYLTWEKESYTKNHKNDPGYKPITDPAQVDLADEERFEYKPYDYDTFISGIVWNDNNDFKDIDNDIVYQAMAIIERSRLIADLPSNCVVLKEYNSQAARFIELDGSEVKYNEITKAVAASKGIIITRDGKSIKAMYEPFTYTYKRYEEDASTKRDYFYHMAHKNNEEIQRIPANWVDDLEQEKGVEIPKEKVDESEIRIMSSFSLYGAKHYIEKEDVEYDLYRILKYYFGQDIDFYTIDYAFSDDFSISGCSPISMNGTSLSRDEFILLAQKYGSRGGGAKILADNAGMIYDLATSNGINPELVFVRAQVEGYSPGSSHNNYWGIGCTNTGGLAACHSYSSLSEGVSAFLKTISGYTSLGDFYKYAYLGDYWYNPGSWGKGGCPYANAIFNGNIPERVRNACASGKICETGREADCVPTTKEDRQLYADFQAQEMVKARKSIFGLDADICEPQYSPGSIGSPGVGSCTIWKQSDSRWGNIHLGNSQSTMSGSGCLVTSVAIAISCSNVQINDVASFNPKTFVEKLNATGGFQGANYRWNNAAVNFYAPNFHYVGNYNVSGSEQEKVQMVVSRAVGNTSVLLHFVNDEHSRGHWVVFKSVSGTTFTVYDPAYGRVNTYSASDLDRLAIYRF